jgi:hypothetical protein
VPQTALHPLNDLPGQRPLQGGLTAEKEGLSAEVFDQHRRLGAEGLPWDALGQWQPLCARGRHKTLRQAVTGRLGEAAVVVHKMWCSL